jgi:hypothetical protein
MTPHYTATFRLLIGAVLLGVAPAGQAQEKAPPDAAHHNSYGVSDWRNSVPERAVEFKTFRTIVLTNPTYSDDEKAAKIASKFRAIRDAVRKERVALYEAISETRGVGNSASGRGKTSDAECIGGTKSNMYTKPEWAQGAYKSGSDEANVSLLSTGLAAGDIVNPDGSLVCAIKLKQSGSGRKVSYSQAVFRVRPEHIKKMVDEELSSLMFAISNTPV